MNAKRMSWWLYATRYTNHRLIEISIHSMTFLKNKRAFFLSCTHRRKKMYGFSLTINTNFTAFSKPPTTANSNAFSRRLLSHSENGRFRATIPQYVTAGLDEQNRLPHCLLACRNELFKTHTHTRTGQRRWKPSKFLLFPTKSSVNVFICVALNR